jgi:hypothetical protein
MYSNVRLAQPYIYIYMRVCASVSLSLSLFLCVCVCVYVCACIQREVCLIGRSGSEGCQHSDYQRLGHTYIELARELPVVRKNWRRLVDSLPKSKPLFDHFYSLGSVTQPKRDRIVALSALQDLR